MIGTKVAHYTITGVLGKGGMGVVYEARDHHLDRIVALKILPPDVSANRNRQQRFVREAKAASALNHPGIVTIYDIASADGFDYIAMELVHGQTLEQVLSRGPMPFDAAMKVGDQIADAMGAAHAAGIVHRDLKPGNIMINERGDAKVLDFGLAKLTEEENISDDQPTLMAHAPTEEGTVLGTGPYMSPEQVEAQKVDARSDIFSFGAVLYEMATGNCVFARSSLAATMAAVLKDNPAPPSALVPGLPQDFDRVISKCLAKDPLRRTQSMAEVQSDIRSFLHKSQDNVQSAAPRRRFRFRRYYAAAGAAALLLIATALIVRGVLIRRISVPASFHATILTSFIGYNGDPSLSPDGNQLAFDWNGDASDKPSHVYLSLLGKGSPLRLSPENVGACCPAWSPDGQSIALLRETKPDSDEVELVVMPALGGAGRVLVTGKDIYRYPTWSPDGRWLVWSQMEQISSLWAVLAAGAEPRRIDDPGRVKAGGGDFGASISPDGRQIAFDRVVADFDSDLFVADFHEGRITSSPRQLTFEHEAQGPPVWSETGQDIFYVNGSLYGSQPSIRRIPAAGGQPRVIEGIGQNADELAYSLKAHRLVYSTTYENFDIHRLDLGDLSATPQRFVSSNRFDTSPTYSPDGKHITFDSNRGGSREIWVADADGSNATPITSFGRGITGSGQWSPDGKYLVFDARPDADADVYIIAASGGSVRKLTNYTGEDHNAHFSPDGKWIYFASRRSGGHEIFRMRLDGSGVEQITHDDAVFPMFGKDGKWLYYSIRNKGIWKMPIDGGPAVQVLNERQSLSPYTYTITAKGIYALAKKGEKKYEIVFYPFEKGKPRTLLALDRPIYMYPAVSPDERYLLYTTADDPVYEMMLVENFR